MSSEPTVSATPCPCGPEAVVAVITRTKDRPLLLARAAESIARQTFDALVWVVVNDGGDEGGARRAIAAARLPADRIVFLTASDSVGMEAAANRGARASRSRFLVIHDDDDSWHPAFLARTVGFLDSARGRHYGGVVTIADYVSEEMGASGVVEHARRPYNDQLGSVQLAEMLVRNLFPPISFLFRRSVWERAGGFNERLPVLGDWYFNIRFLLEADIAVLPERLAGWHHRDRAGTAAGAPYANSVIGGASLHEEYNAVVRNMLVRDLAASHPAAVAPLIGYMMQELRREAGGLRRTLGSASIGAVEVTGTAAGSVQPDHAALLAHVVDIADRRWTLAQLPLRLRLKHWSAARKVAREPSWAELGPAVRSARLLPPIDFDEAGYRSANPDVESSVAAGTFTSGYEHYIRYGRLEGRRRPLRLPSSTGI